MKHTDEKIKTDIVNRFHWDAGIDATDVLIEVNESVVRLSGTVTSYKDRINYESRGLDDQ